MKKILYIYDFEDWALHNVGKYWARLVADCAQFEFAEWGPHESYHPCEFDFVWWGCSYMAEKHISRLLHRFIPRRAPEWNPKKNANFITVIHDPCELFPQTANWRHLRPRRLAKIRSFARCGVISSELHTVMKAVGFDCQVINTNSLLPIRPFEDIQIEPLKIYSRAKDIPRKNLNLFRALKTPLSSACDRFDGYFDDTILPDAEYIGLIDLYNCYICTSWQEGGPLPLMDAMRRGCTVITTPVGQTPDLLEDGISGFFCTTFKEFKECILLLANDSQRLYSMRQKAQLAVAQRSDAIVREQLIQFLDLCDKTGSGKDERG